jgi:hypothetical protein
LGLRNALISTPGARSRFIALCPEHLVVPLAEGMTGFAENPLPSRLIRKDLFQRPGKDLNGIQAVGFHAGYYARLQRRVAFPTNFRFPTQTRASGL